MPTIRLNSRLVSFALLFCLSFGANAAKLTINMLYLEQPKEAIYGLANTLTPPEDQGLQGVNTGIADSNSTGKFLGQKYQAKTFINEDPKALIEHAKTWLAGADNHTIIANVSKQTLLELSKITAANKRPIVFNVAVKDNILRQTQCESGLLHTIPSRVMLSDALVQFLNRKRWKKVLLINGTQAEDTLYSDSLKYSMRRFGGKIIKEKTWSFDSDLRRLAQKEVPLFTQAKDYDIVLIADELGYFGDYILYNTWLPRPVGGTQGLKPTGWHRLVEQWGAIQLQNRFHDQANRWMTEIDYAAWAAVRSISEAVTRTKSIDRDTIYNYLLSDKFELAAFKGRPLSFRNWNGQLRQTIPLVHPHGLVSLSPQEGYLHPVSELDTLGFDKTEVSCNFN